MNTAIRGRKFGRGEAIRNVTMDRLTIEHCWTDEGPPDELRPIIENCEFTRLTYKRSHLTGAVLRDVTVNGIKTDSHSSFLRANEFERVTIRGRVHYLVLSTTPSTTTRTAEYKAALDKADLSDEWSLDISEAVGPIEVRGYAARRIRINPETQAVVTRSTLQDGQWRDIAGDTLVKTRLQMMLDHGWNDTVLVVDPTSKEFAEEKAALDRLRAEGIAE